ncbi:MAG: MBL fold metallo-hydrolase [Planctomycetota bacterium]
MAVTNAQSGTRIDEIADSIYRISTPVPPNPALPAGFTFNQFLIVDDEPLLFHTGPRRMFALTSEAVATVMPVGKLRWVSFSHFEADECGALEQWLAAAPHAAPLCSSIAAMVSVGDVSPRAPRAFADGETIALGRKRVRWFDAPHVPHGWDSGFLAETTTRTLFCGDLLTQPGATHDPVTTGDVLGPSEAMRAAMDYYSNAQTAGAAIERLAAFGPALLACMHGAAYRGDGAAVLRALARRLAGAKGG